MNGITNGIPDSPSPSLHGILIGRPVQIVALADDSPTVASSADENAEQVVERFVLIEDALRNVVSRPELRGLRTMVLSVAGAFRKGKSFLLDFMLRFLQYAEQKQRENPKWAPDMGDDSWFGDLSAPLEGSHSPFPSPRHCISASSRPSTSALLPSAPLHCFFQSLSLDRSTSTSTNT